MKRQQKVLILGRLGQVGSKLLQHAPAWAAVEGMDRSSLDMGNTQAIRTVVRAAKPDIIINASAYTAVDLAETEQAKAAAINTVAVRTLAEEAARSNAKLVHYSTDYVFDGTSAKPYQPDDPKNPLSIYGRTKSEGEDAILATLEGRQFLLVRTAWVYAPSGKNFVNTMLRLMQEKPFLNVVSDQIGSPTSAANLALVTWQALSAEVGGIQHFTDAGVASWYDFAQAIGNLAVREGRIKTCPPIVPILSSNFPQAARRPSYSVLDKSGFWAAANITPQHWQLALESSYAGL